MWFPALRGRIDRRLLLNFRVDPSVLAAVVPAPFRPQVVRGWGVAGICLIRLAEVRPFGVPRALGLSSENAAHRIAVEWNEGGELFRGVFIPRRHTSSRLNALAGGVVFPGEHHRARFDVDERDGRFHIDVASDADATRVSVTARLAGEVAQGSVFATMHEASSFFRAGSVGFSVTRRPRELDAIELRTLDWPMESLAVESASSSWLSDPDRFPSGTVELDSAFLLRDVEHEWHGRGVFVCGDWAAADGPHIASRANRSSPSVA